MVVIFSPDSSGNPFLCRSDSEGTKKIVADSGISSKKNIYLMFERLRH
jgi:hypothetical protein